MRLKDNTFASVLLRHYPQLPEAIRGHANAFTLWSRSGAAAAAAG